MKKLPRKLWHAVHLTSIPMFVLATVHGFTSGADNRNLAVQWVALTGGLFVFLLVTFRVLAPRRSAPAREPRADPPGGAIRDSAPAEAGLRRGGARRRPRRPRTRPRPRRAPRPRPSFADEHRRPRPTGCVADVSRLRRPRRSAPRAGCRRAIRGTAWSRSRRCRRRRRPSGSRSRTRPCPRSAG